MNTHNNVATMLLSISALIASSHAYALESMSDSQLADKTGQDGITISISNDGTIGLDQLTYVNVDGFTNQPNAAGMSLKFAQQNGNPQPIEFCTEGTATVASGCGAGNLNTQATKIVVDTEGGATAGSSADAFLNAHISMSSKGVYLPIQKITMQGRDADNSNNTKVGIVPDWDSSLDIVDFSSVNASGDRAGIAINMANPIELNLQLGNQPQGAMAIINPNTLDIDMGTFDIVSNNGAIRQSQISTNVMVEGFTVPRNAIGIDGNKLFIASAGSDTTTSIQSIKISDTVLGRTGNSSTSVFNGLNNGSIGNIAINNVQLNNHRLTIQGMN